MISKEWLRSSVVHMLGVTPPRSRNAPVKHQASEGLAGPRKAQKDSPGREFREGRQGRQSVEAETTTG